MSETMQLGPKPYETERRSRPKPRRRARLLQREDWPTLLVIYGGCAIISIVCAFVGNVLASIW